MTARYLLCPGPYIPASHLAHLYGVRMADCRVMPSGSSHRDHITRRDLNAQADRGELIRLAPRADGDYSLPAAAKN